MVNKVGCATEPVFKPLVEAVTELVDITRLNRVFGIETICRGDGRV